MIFQEVHFIQVQIQHGDDHDDHGHRDHDAHDGHDHDDRDDHDHDHVPVHAYVPLFMQVAIIVVALHQLQVRFCQ